MILEQAPNNPTTRTYLEFKGERAFLETLENKRFSPRPFRNASQARNAFYYFDNYANAINTFLHKPEELIKYVRSEYNLINPNEIGSEFWMDVSGDFLDVATYLEGDPECFGNMFMGNPKRIFITLLIKLDVPWTSTVDYLNYYTARILRLVDWLESKEVRTRIICFSSTEMEHMEINIKDFYEPLPLASLAVTCNPDFYRRCVFSLREDLIGWDASYGSTKEADKLHMATFGQLAKDGNFMIYLDRRAYENNIDATKEAFDTTEEYIISMLADEEERGSILV